MGFPKKIKKNIPLNYPKTLFPRREELLDQINKDGTFLPKSILHADLDRGFLDFVKNDLGLVVEGTTVPTVDIIITTQSWAQFTETWNFVDLDFNVKPPFITTVRTPEVKFGTNPATLYNIPNRKQYFYATVPTWDGKKLGADVYKIPQPIPVDITYQVKIVCNRMRELNRFNQVVLGKFASRQAYTVVKGHYIPIIWNNISDESVMDLDKRKYYVQSYEFVMLGFLIDEEEFQVKPAVSRVLEMFEVDTSLRNAKRAEIEPPNPNEYPFNFFYTTGNTTLSDVIDYRIDLNLVGTTNVDTFDVYINSDYYGSDLDLIQLNTGDIISIEVNKEIGGQEAQIDFIARLL